MPPEVTTAATTTATTAETTAAATETKPDLSLTGGKTSLLAQALDKAPGATEKAADATTDGEKSAESKPAAPDAYTDFTLPEGLTLTAESMTEAKGLFKEAGISQEAAQRFVDMHTKALKAVTDGPAQLWKDTQETWVEELRSDPVIGKGIDNGTVGASISKMLSLLPDTASVAMREAFNFTGAGNHPAIVRGLFQLSKLLTEPGHVQGKGPADTTKTRPSGAHAMYPNLVKKDGA